MYKIVNKISELPNFDLTQPIFSDIETSGLYTNFRMVQFFQPLTSDDVYIVDIAQTGYDINEYETELEEIKKFILSTWTVWYNASYDLGTLNISPMLNGSNVDDLYYLVKTAYAEFNKDGFGLKKVVKKFRHTKDLYSSTMEDHGAKGFPLGSYVSKSAYRYAAIDVIALSKMWDDPKIKDVKLTNLAYKVDMLSQSYALKYQQNGLILHRGKWKGSLAKARIDLENSSSKIPQDLNVNSPKQVREFLGTESSNAATLIAFAMSDDINAGYAEHILNTRKFKKQVKYLESINFNKMYTKFNVAGAASGRFTANGGDLPDGFNSQQVPRNFTELFNSDTEDTTVVGLDYGALELRLIAGIFGEQYMVDQFNEGRDLHTEMALTISDKKLHPDGVINMDSLNTGKSGSLDNMKGEWITNIDRVIAKSVNFGLVA